MSETKMMKEDKKELTIAGSGNVLLNENGGFILRIWWLYRVIWRLVNAFR